MDRAHHLDRAFARVRALVVFCLGVALVLDAVVQTGQTTPELVAGLVLLGIVPLDVFLARRA
jgi:hypothetical protein